MNAEALGMSPGIGRVSVASTSLLRVAVESLPALAKAADVLRMEGSNQMV